jgi:inosine-uridine nucleoside N-ribohydrolase
MSKRVALIAAACLTVLVGGCFSSAPPEASPQTTGVPSPDRRPIIIDADFDQSDIAAILILLRDPTLDVRAITIAGTGLVHCQGGRLVTRYLLDEMGASDIPFGCGREAGGADARPFPDDWRAIADAGYGLDITPKVEAGTPRDAVEVLRTAVDESPSAPTVIALGPLTNLEDAFAADPTLPDRIALVHAMLGTVDAPGNVYVDGFDGNDPLEWNAFADPSAVTAVFDSDVPIAIVPLDATDDVPVPADLADRLATDHAAGGADLEYELLLRNPSRMAQDQGQQLWDELAALALGDPDLVAWSDVDLTVGDDGRLTRDPAGRAVRFATSADRAATEDALLQSLRLGGPRMTPFELAGTLTTSWDGTTCTLTGDPGGPGLYTVTYQGPAGVPSGVMIPGVLAPHDWADLAEFVSGIDVSSDQDLEIPDWLVEGGQVTDEAGDGTLHVGTAQLRDATHGPICLGGTWPDMTLTLGEPFAFGG